MTSRDSLARATQEVSGHRFGEKSGFYRRDLVPGDKTRQGVVTAVAASEPVWPSGKALSPFLTGRMFVREPS